MAEKHEVVKFEKQMKSAQRYAQTAVSNFYFWEEKDLQHPESEL